MTAGAAARPVHRERVPGVEPAMHCLVGISPKLYTCSLHQFFAHVCHVTYGRAWYSSGGVATHYVGPCFLGDVMFVYIMARNRRHKKRI